MMLADGTLGQMMEPVSLDMGEMKTHEKPWALTGTEGKRPHNIVNSLALDPQQLEDWNVARFKRYETLKKEAMFEEYRMEDAEICVVAFGIAARISKNAVNALREKGVKAGLIRPITLYPFPVQAIRAAADRCKAFLSVELSMGQMIEDVKLAAECRRPVYLCSRTGGMIPTPEEVVAAVEKIAEGGNE